MQERTHEIHPPTHDKWTTLQQAKAITEQRTEREISRVLQRQWTQGIKLDKEEEEKLLTYIQEGTPTTLDKIIQPEHSEEKIPLEIIAPIEIIPKIADILG